jgi:hypothetical protein
MDDVERDLGTVQGGQRHALLPPHPLFPCTRLDLICFEVLEATRNPTEDALRGGGFYYPEGFPFSNM